MKLQLILFSLFLVPPFSVAIAKSPTHESHYAGQEKRTIKSLSADDIAQLEKGKGWGLAKAAELNGMPGPSHVLQMKDKINLTREQEKKIKALFNDMKVKAIPLGKQLIQLEKDLNDSFAKRQITTESLKKKLSEISSVHYELRYIHLVTHLMTPDILTKDQIEKYNKLRGYGSGDPCKSVPSGHDAEMWKKHNNCK